jgi:cell division septum initiation protein DivIVA
MSGFKLYEVAGFLQQVIDAVNAQAEQAEGEISEDWSELLDAVTEERDIKALGIASYIKNLTAEAEAIKAEKQKLAKRQAATENRIESLKNYLSAYLRQGEKISDATTVIGWRKSTVLHILDESAIPDAYFKVERTPMKTEIKDAVKNGAEIGGVELVEKQSIQIK